MTNTLMVRPLSPNYVDDILAFETVNRHFFEQWTPSRASSFFDRDEQITKLQALANDPMGRYCVIVDHNGCIIGRVNISFLMRQDTLVANLGYRVAQDQQGKGIATLALNTTLDWIMADGRFSMIEAYAMKSNLGSVKVLKKIGLREVPGYTIAEKLNKQPITLQLFRRTLIE